MRKSRALFACCLAACSLSGCAVFQANPNDSTCQRTANQVMAAQDALVLAQATLTAVEAGQQKTSRTLDELQADVTAAQTVLNTANALYVQRCTSPAPVVATPSQPPARTPQP